MTTIIILFACMAFIAWGICILGKVIYWVDADEDADEGDMVFFYFGIIGIIISLFIIWVVALCALVYQQPFNYRPVVIYLTILIGIRMIVGFFRRLYLYYEKRSEEKKQEKKQEKEKVKRSEGKILAKARRKVINHLLGRAKAESSSLIPILDEEMAEMVEAIREKSYESYNNFMAGKEDFETAQGILEEAVSDLLVLKEMARPKTPDSITFYDILGVEADASEAEVTEAYKDLIRLVHPDVVADQESKEAATNLATLVNVAYKQLKNNHNRRAI